MRERDLKLITDSNTHSAIGIRLYLFIYLFIYLCIHSHFPSKVVNENDATRSNYSLAAVVFYLKHSENTSITLF